MEYFNVYNKYGEKTDQIVERTTAHKEGVCHRVVHLWIMNSQNQLLLQQRSANKDSGASLWYISVGGHIDKSEDIETTLIREAQEELGIDISSMTDSIEYLFTFKEFQSTQNNTFLDDEFYDVFLLKADFDLNQLILQEEEVQAVKYMDYAEFKKLILSGDKSFLHHDIAYKMLFLILEQSHI
jgi:Isopentenyldiphosphate isomerase